MAVNDDAWQETAGVSIMVQGGTEDIPFQSITEEIEFDGFEKDFESIATLSGGRLVKVTSEGDVTVTLTAYPQEAGNLDVSAATTPTGFFDMLHAEDTGEAQVISATRARTKYRIAVLWTDATITNANQAIVSPTNKCLRFVGANGYITSVKPSFSDKLLKFEVTFKLPPFDSAGAANYKWESVNGETGATVTLTALASYTTSAKW